MKPDRKKLQALVAKVQGLAPDAERLSALDDIFAICNQCSTRSERRAFYDLIPPKKIPLLAKLAVARSGKGTVALSPGAEKLLDELATWAKSYDPAPDLAADAILRGDEKTISQFCEAIVSHLQNVHPAWVSKIRFGLWYDGRQRILTLAEIVREKLGTAKAQDLARTLLRAIRCPECSKEQKKIHCGCGCRRRLCERCAEIDDTTRMILSELARAS